jgi:hypothetical protein
VGAGGMVTASKTQGPPYRHGPDGVSRGRTCGEGTVIRPTAHLHTYTEPPVP